MGLIFRRSVKILPGVRLNFSKSGVSTSFGTRGARVTVGKNRVTSSIGIPGTGIYYRTSTSRKKSKRQSTGYYSGSYSSYSGNSTTYQPVDSKFRNDTWVICAGILFVVVLALFLWSFTWSWESHYREYYGQRIYDYTDLSWLKWIFYPPVCFFGLVFGGIFFSELMKPKEGSDKEDNLSSNSESIAEEKAKVDDTPLEVKAFELIKKITNPIADVKHLTYRDEPNYCAVYFDNLDKKPVCRFYFNNGANFIALFDKTGTMSTKHLERLADIYLYADDIRSLIKQYNA